MALPLDRIEIESAGADPVRLAGAVIAQMSDLKGPVPVHEVALALDILEIRELPGASFEGCLVTDGHKSRGAIVLKAERPGQRQRFTVAHELGHFLNERHWPTRDWGFRCTKADVSNPIGEARHVRQELEANIFAIELLAPRRLIAKHLVGSACIEDILKIAQERDISREAAARRYVALHNDRLAVVVTHEGGVVRYVEKGPGFPWVRYWTGSRAPVIKQRGISEITAQVEGDPEQWFERPTNVGLSVQTCHQADRRALTLLRVQR